MVVYAIQRDDGMYLGRRSFGGRGGRRAWSPDHPDLWARKASAINVVNDMQRSMGARVAIRAYTLLEVPNEQSKTPEDSEAVCSREQVA